MTATPEHGNETRYPATKVERKWQDRWDKDGLYQVNDDDPRPKWYELTMYPYPLVHIGRCRCPRPSSTYERVQRHAPDGIRLFRSACGERGYQGGSSPIRKHDG